MSLDADVIVDRRRLRRKLAVWRIIGFVAIAAVIIAAISYFADVGDVVNKHRAHIARINISGMITDSRKQQALIAKIVKSKAVKGVVISINSPGGTTTGGEALFEALRDLAEKKPTVAHIGTLGASAGYMVALASDHIVARRSSLTGSIGVIIQFGEASKLLDIIGIKMDEVKSAPLKAQPNFFQPASPEARAVLEDVVRDSYEWFVGMVSDRRSMEMDKALRLADGRIYTGAQALENGLIDAVGGEKKAIEWLESKREVEKGLPIRDWKTKNRIDDLSFSEAIMRNLIRVIGGKILSGVGGDVNFLPDAVELDGLLSVWQARLTSDKIIAEGASR